MSYHAPFCFSIIVDTWLLSLSSRWPFVLLFPSPRSKPHTSSSRASRQYLNQGVKLQEARAERTSSGLTFFKFLFYPTSTLHKTGENTPMSMVESQSLSETPHSLSSHLSRRWTVVSFTYKAKPTGFLQHTQLGQDKRSQVSWKVLQALLLPQTINVSGPHIGR